jgi:hypothetical protein
MGEKPNVEFKRFDRAFLNGPGFHGSAHILYNICIETNSEGERYGYASFDIGDCSRKVSLDLSFEKDQRENSIHKLSLLIEKLHDFEENLLEAIRILDGA